LKGKNYFILKRVGTKLNKDNKYRDKFEQK